MGTLAALMGVVGLAACAPQPRPALYGSPGGSLFGGSTIGSVPSAPEALTAKVAVLLPMSGPQAALGPAMMNAATLALFDSGVRGVELVPRDTTGSAGGASEAVRSAISDGARVVVGPLTGAETAAAAGQARAASVPVLAFTNDVEQGGNGVWVTGITPSQQVRRLLASARTAGVQRVGLAGPEGPFTRQLAAALRNASREAGLPPPVVVTYPSGASRAQAAGLVAQQAGTEGLGLLILGEGGAGAREMAAALAGAGLPTPPLRLGGTVLWANDATLASEPALAGALVPGPDPLARNGFESRYQAAYGERPPRLAATAYDATAAALRGVRGGDPRAAAQLPIGEPLQGADGTFRLLPDGQVQRALAVYALTPGAEPRMVEPAILPGAAGS
ncbi:penicillin-binding protein activator [Roseomonas indoligenes]|uniref:Penicillin-binding protein activator n=1 Tax=Roseomonas indoligenes TaxID=2820811 RepID=A0A940S549_9PROT|nr:penicillin-binding protein activator [Pararoseomonas indoligenes]MBP0494021.1 penicillin-binding protein activator [Pararoseomonas indoligenes]